MLEPVSRLTQAFAESLMQTAQHRERPLVLILDTYEKAQSYLNQWLWQYLVEDTSLSATPVKLLVVGRRPLEADEEWRKLNQDRKLLHHVQLRKFSKPDTDNYLKRIGIDNGGTRAKIYRTTQGLPYYLDWVRKQYEQGNNPDLSRGNQAIAELLFQGIAPQQRKILQVVACCRWFDLALFRYLLDTDDIFLGRGSDNIEKYFEWIKRSDFVEYTQGYYRLDDVARDIFRKSYFQDSRLQFRKTNILLAEYFKQQADNIVEPQTLLPDPYEDEDWKELISEYLYYGLFGYGKKGLQRFIEYAFVAIYLREPDVFISPVISVMPGPKDEVEDLLPQITLKFFEDSGMALVLGWPLLSKSPRSYKIKLEMEDSSSTEAAADIFQKKIEASIQSLLGYVNDLEDGFAKCIGSLYKSIRAKDAKEEHDSLLQAKIQSEQLTVCALPQLTFSVLSNLSRLLNKANLHEEALECIDQALIFGEVDARLLFTQGTSLSSLNRHEEALESFHKLTKIESENLSAWAYKTLSFFILGHNEEALESIQRVTDIEELSPKNTAPWSIKSIALSNLRRYEEALECSRLVINNASDSADCFNIYALQLSHLGRFEAALEALDQATLLEPENVLLKANRGIILARAGQHKEGFEVCEQAISQNPKDESGYYAKACCHALQGNVEQSIDNLKLAIDIEPIYSRSQARTNPDFDSIRSDERFSALVNTAKSN